MTDEQEIQRLKSGIIKLGAEALMKRPFPDREYSKKELFVQLEKADEDMRQLGLAARRLYDGEGLLRDTMRTFMSENDS